MNFASKLSISPNGRFLQDEKGAPFFYLADTAWELFHRLRLEEAAQYFKIRKEQGFNVILSVALPENDGLRTPNAFNQLPLHEMNPYKPNEDYFTILDKFISLAADHGLFIALVPSWGDKVDPMFGIGPKIFNPESAGWYGRWIGSRYKAYWNIIWIIGGDRPGGGKNYADWDALAKGIREADPNHLMSYHPQGDASSSMWFHEQPWLDFNLCQSGHSMRAYPNYMMITYDYLRTPAKPCMDGEPRYEAHAVNWKPEQNGVFNDYDVRQAAYWAVFAGACGHTYGAHPVWQMYDFGREPVGFVQGSWKEALELPGANQLIHLKNLMLSRSYFERVPDLDLVPGPKVGDEHIRTTRGAAYAFFYLPAGGLIELDGTPLGASDVEAQWFDPRDGKCIPIGSFACLPGMQFHAPSKGPAQDWVLILDSNQGKENSLKKEKK